MTTVAEFVEYFRCIGLTGTGCANADIDAIEKSFGQTFPASYKAYLLIAGKYPPPFWVGTNCVLNDLSELRSGAEELLLECGQPFELPKNAFVFAMHQGYQFMYFLVGESDDPEVFYYYEGKPAAVQHSPRFTDLIADCVRGG